MSNAFQWLNGFLEIPVVSDASIASCSLYRVLLPNTIGPLQMP
jgi:hypothetical protein